jgi:hypothetical protein
MTLFEYVMEQHKNNVSATLSDLSNRIVTDISSDKWEGFDTEINLKTLGIDRNYQNEIFKTVNEKYPNEFEIKNDILKKKETK